MRRLLVIAAAAALSLSLAPAAEARKSPKKGIWGPVSVGGVSQFPIYRELGAGVYNTYLYWHRTAPTRPARPRDPRDPAYAWPAELDEAVAEAKRYRMKLAVLVMLTPPWANGGRPKQWAPDRARDFSDFLTAAVRRYRSVRYWIVWGEPTRQSNFMPIEKTDPRVPLPRAHRAAPQRYARLLDSAYVAIKRVNRRARVVGGNSFVTGDIGPRNWIANLRLPSGRRPRMDLYGHNPFGARSPDLRGKPIIPGNADFADLDDLARWVDRYLGRRPGGGRIRLWLGEYTQPTQERSGFGFHVSEETQAAWLAEALRITRRWKRIAALNWLQLYDQPARPDKNFLSFGLITADGRRKPSFDAFKRG